MTASRSESHLIRECAELHGVKIRAVQVWRQRGDTRWKEFLERRESAAASVAQMALIALPGGKLTPQQLEEAASSRLARINESAEQLFARGDLASMIQVNKVANDCHKLLAEVMERNANIEVSIGRLVKAETVREWIGTNLALVKQQLENLPAVLAGRIESQMDVSGIVRYEIEAILRELSVAAGSAPWSPKTASSDDAEEKFSENQKV